MNMKKTLAVLLSSTLLFATALPAQKKAVAPPGANPNSPFSPGMLVDGVLYVSGTVGTDPKIKDIPDNFEDEVHACMDNLGAVLKAGNMDFDDVVSVMVYLTDMTLFQRFNTVYVSYFKKPLPARTSAGVVRLAAAKAHVEITLIAKKQKKK